MAGGFDGDIVTLPGINPDCPDGITTLVNTLLSESLASTTKANYTSKMKLFIKFLMQYGLLNTSPQGAQPVIPEVTPTLLMFFSAYMVMKGLKSAGSIAGYCGAVKQWCLIHDRPDPTLNPRSQTIDIRYARLHRAIKRRLGTKSSERRPLSIDDLKNVLTSFRSGLIVHADMIDDFLAAVLLGFYAMLRVSEFTNRHTTIHDGLREASRSDIQFFGPPDDPDGFKFVVKVSKTTQFRTIQTLTIFKSPDPLVCPVRAMHRLYNTDPRAGSTPLFDFTRRTSNDKNRAVSGARSWFIREFQAATRFCGLSTSQIQSHSLRSGGATAYLQAGVDPYIIQRMGRWRSWCWMIYTWASTLHIQNAMESIAMCDHGAKPVNLDEVRW